MNEQLLYALVACAVMLGIGFPIHEFSHAWAAFRLGDSTARYRGRLTLNPLVHFDPFGGTLLIITAVLSSGTAFFGFAKPTPVNPMNLSGGRRGEAIVAAAGPISNLVMAAVVAIPLRLVLSSLTSGSFANDMIIVVLNVLLYFVLINLSLFVFNLIPVPPLDGWAVLVGLVSSRAAWQLRQFQAQYAAIIPFAFLLVFFVAGRTILGPIVGFLAGILLGRNL